MPPRVEALQPGDLGDIPGERVVLDASVLLGNRRQYLFAAADLGYYTGYWSSWIIGEIVRKRTEWVAERAARDGCDRVEMRRRLLGSRERVNAVVADLSRVLRLVDYRQRTLEDLSWLRDSDDWPVMQTALAARADTLVTDNSKDFPLGEVRNGVLILGSEAFLSAIYAKFPDAEATIRQYLQAARPMPNP